MAAPPSRALAQRGSGLLVGQDNQVVGAGRQRRRRPVEPHEIAHRRTGRTPPGTDDRGRPRVVRLREQAYAGARRVSVVGDDEQRVEDLPGTGDGQPRNVRLARVSQTRRHHRAQQRGLPDRLLADLPVHAAFGNGQRLPDARPEGQWLLVEQAAGLAVDVGAGRVERGVLAEFRDPGEVPHLGQQPWRLGHDHDVQHREQFLAALAVIERAHPAAGTPTAGREPLDEVPRATMRQDRGPPGVRHPLLERPPLTAFDEQLAMRIEPDRIDRPPVPGKGFAGPEADRLELPGSLRVGNASPGGVLPDGALAGASRGRGPSGDGIRHDASGAAPRTPPNRRRDRHAGSRHIGAESETLGPKHAVRRGPPHRARAGALPWPAYRDADHLRGCAALAGPPERPRCQPVSAGVGGVSGRCQRARAGWAHDS